MYWFRVGIRVRVTVTVRVRVVRLTWDPGNQDSASCLVLCDQVPSLALHPWGDDDTGHCMGNVLCAWVKSQYLGLAYTHYIAGVMERNLSSPLQWGTPDPRQTRSSGEKLRRFRGPHNKYPALCLGRPDLSLFQSPFPAAPQHARKTFPQPWAKIHPDPLETWPEEGAGALCLPVGSAVSQRGYKQPSALGQTVKGI